MAQSPSFFLLKKLQTGKELGFSEVSSFAGPSTILSRTIRTIDRGARWCREAARPRAAAGSVSYRQPPLFRKACRYCRTLVSFSLGSAGTPMQTWSSRSRQVSWPDNRRSELWRRDWPRESAGRGPQSLEAGEQREETRLIRLKARRAKSIKRKYTKQEQRGVPA